MTFSGGFVDVEWLAYPWMYVMIRYDGVNSHSDYANALVPGGFTGSPFNGAASATRNRITPAVQFLIHANIKAVAEYQFRPGQSVDVCHESDYRPADGSKFVPYQHAGFGI